MKTMKSLLLLAMCLIATSTVTSCLNNDGDDFDYRMTPEETAAYLTRLSGVYHGKMVFMHRGRNKAGTQDSLIRDSIMNMSWRIYSDSTVQIANFPDSIFNNTVTGNTDVRKILKQAPTRSTLTCYYAPYKGKDTNGNIDYGFYIIAKPDVDETSTSYYAYTQSKFTADDGKEYTAKYGYTSYISDGYYRTQAMGYLSKDNKLEFLLYVGKVECNNVQSFTSVPYQILFSGNKLY